MFEGRLERVAHVVARGEGDPVRKGRQLPPHDVPVNGIQPTVGWVEEKGDGIGERERGGGKGEGEGGK